MRQYASLGWYEYIITFREYSWRKRHEKSKNTFIHPCFHTLVFYQVINISLVKSALYVNICSFLKKILFFLEGKGVRQRGKETSVCGCLSNTPHWGPGLQPRHVPWLGIEPVTLWFTGQHSVHWATRARAISVLENGNNTKPLQLSDTEMMCCVLRESQDCSHASAF